MENKKYHLKTAWRKTAGIFKGVGYTETSIGFKAPEGLFVRGVSIDEYEKGDLTFSSFANQPIGTMAVAQYRKLKKQPYREPSVYLFQFANVFKMILFSLGIFCLGVPAAMFWLVALGVISGQMQLNDLLVSDVRGIFLTLSTALCLFVILGVGIFSKGRLLGLKNMFTRRFEALLESNIAALKDLSGYGLSWQAQPFKQAD